jgi:F-type H+-transporting ATPase subunit delta
MPEALPQHATVMDPTAWTVAEAYAQAAIGLCADLSSCQEFSEELQALAALMRENQDFADLLAGPIVSSKNKLALLHRVFGGRVSESLEALLAVMSARGRLILINAVSVKFRQLVEVREGKIEVSVTTACALSELELRDLTAKLSEAMQSKIILKASVQKDLIGGMIIRVGDKVFDASLKQDLDRMLRQMLSGSMSPALGKTVG